MNKIKITESYTIESPIARYGLVLLAIITILLALVSFGKTAHAATAPYSDNSQIDLKGRKILFEEYGPDTRLFIRTYGPNDTHKDVFINEQPIPGDLRGAVMLKNGDVVFRVEYRNELTNTFIIDIYHYSKGNLQIIRSYTGRSHFAQDKVYETSKIGITPSEEKTILGVATPDTMTLPVMNDAVVYMSETKVAISETVIMPSKSNVKGVGSASAAYTRMRVLDIYGDNDQTMMLDTFNKRVKKSSTKSSKIQVTSEVKYKKCDNPYLALIYGNKPMCPDYTEQKVVSGKNTLFVFKVTDSMGIASQRLGMGKTTTNPYMFSHDGKYALVFVQRPGGSLIDYSGHQTFLVELKTGRVNKVADKFVPVYMQ